MVALEMSNRISVSKEDMHTHERGCAWLAGFLFVAILTRASGSIPLPASKFALLQRVMIGKF
jgi:hypothetical protein